RQRELWAQQLTTKEQLDKSENDVKIAKTELAAREAALSSSAQMINQEAATLDTSRYHLRQVTLATRGASWGGVAATPAGAARWSRRWATPAPAATSRKARTSSSGR